MIAHQYKADLKYSGGSLVATLLKDKRASIQKLNVFAAVRSSEQAEALSKKGINAIQVDIGDKEAVAKVISEKNSTFNKDRQIS